ncbi:aromatic ring-hydroxylating oxygenase subunit alpha [Scleromatobacter humisilvae]|uniref:Rieske 2Fe-2S domain-containing protein n=1 Tax=Scleromatobacter humisilvae TaxID=2897159 RepID=A0A9X1YSG1_9BURK|nr:Rieske 2Fe-2S domain-containing protein [Scleromatobacter humisilvae]MCK9688341.1 Rieske 2Fe-2S domain-containing protein [Scleromatobacter humisilvae]
MTDLDASLVRGWWHLLCHRRELPAPGDYLRFETVVGDIAVFNDGRDLIAFDNRCPHRGARLYDGASGNRPASCRYHGWTHANGVMIIPQREKFDGCDLTTARLNQYRTDWCGDFLFVGIAPQAALAEQLGEAAGVLENISFNIDACVDVNRYDYECRWPLAIENALEPHHISLVHPETLATLELQDGENRFLGVNSVWEAPVGNARLRRRLESLRRFFRIDHGYEGYFSLYLFPFTMLSSTYGYSYSLQHFFPAPAPDTPRRTSFSSRLLTVPAVDERAASMLRTFIDSTVQVNRRVFEEDHEVCKRLPADSWSTAPLRYPSVDEIKISHFRESCRQHLAAQAPEASA